MNISPGKAVSPRSYRQTFAIRLLTRARTGAMLTALVLSLVTARAAAVNPVQPLKLDGMELFFGIIPADKIGALSGGTQERSMHGGVPRGNGVHHLDVSLFDSKTRARIVDATLTGSVAEPGLATQSKSLEPSSFAGATSYGNYFAMPSQGPYEIVVNVQRPGSGTVSARFQYSHPR